MERASSETDVDPELDHRAEPSTLTKRTGPGESPTSSGMGMRSCEAAKAVTALHWASSAWESRGVRTPKKLAVASTRSLRRLSVSD